jgi:hypothetical protein
MTTRAARTVLLGLCLLAPGGQALADGLERFQRDVLPRVMRGALSYSNAVPHGASGFTLENAVINPMGQDGSKAGGVYRIARLTVEEMDFDHVAAGEAAHFAKVQMTGVRIPETADYAVFLKRYGIFPATADVRLEYRFEPRSHTLSVTRLDISAPGLARVSGEFVVEGVRPPILDRGRIVGDGAIRSARITYDDQSALGRAMRAAAAQSGKSQDSVQHEWLTSLAVIGKGKGPQTSAALDGLASFVQDHRKPKGPLRLTLQPPKPMPIPLIAAMLFVTDFAKTVGLAVSYPGTRANAAAEALLR